MALTASSGSHGLIFSPNSYEWPQINEQFKHHEPRRSLQVSMLVRNANSGNIDSTSNDDKLKLILASGNMMDDFSQSDSGVCESSMYKESAGIDDVKNVREPSKIDVNIDSHCNDSIEKHSGLTYEPTETEFTWQSAQGISESAEGELLEQLSLPELTVAKSEEELHEQPLLLELSSATPEEELHEQPLLLELSSATPEEELHEQPLLLELSSATPEEELHEQPLLLELSSATPEEELHEQPLLLELSSATPEEELHEQPLLLELSSATPEEELHEQPLLLELSSATPEEELHEQPLLLELSSATPEEELHEQPFLLELSSATPEEELHEQPLLLELSSATPEEELHEQPFLLELSSATPEEELHEQPLLLELSSATPEEELHEQPLLLELSSATSEEELPGQLLPPQLSSATSEEELPGQLLLPELSDSTSEPHESVSNSTSMPGNTTLVPSDVDNNCNNTMSPKRVCFKLKKRFKKIRRKSMRKWKEFDYFELGFRVVQMPHLLNEEDLGDGNINTRGDSSVNDVASFEELGCGVENKTDVCNSSVAQNSGQDSSVEEATQPEAIKCDVENKTEICNNNNDIAQNDADNIVFFRALGIDILNLDDYEDEREDLLQWDGVYFPTHRPASRTRQPPHKLKQSHKPKVKSKLAAKVQTGSSLHENVKLKEDELTNTFLPSTTVFSRIKKCDRYKLFELECSSSKRIFIRRDRHRRQEKPHKAVKSKNSRFILQNVGRKRLYMHHRLIKMHNLDLDFRGSVKSYSVPPMPKLKVALDVAKDAFRANRKEMPIEQPVVVQNLNHALHETNISGHLEGDLANFLISLQHRDATPEDYDMLLRLDDTVKPKTVSKNVIEKLRTEIIGPNGADQGSSDWEPLCTICMEPYSLGQERKFLPCNHDFHTPCIDKWLKNSSPNCPLDGLPIE